MWLQKDWERRSALFGMESPWVGPAVRSHHTLPPQAGAEQVRGVFMPLSPPLPPLGLRSPIAFHKLQKCKNSSDFWPEPFIVFER